MSTAVAEAASMVRPVLPTSARTPNATRALATSARGAVRKTIASDTGNGAITAIASGTMSWVTLSTATTPTTRRRPSRATIAASCRHIPAPAMTPEAAATRQLRAAPRATNHANPAFA
ncbi:hypothetical protein [Leifsonia xyli]|uniref:hypothetical protein n=1 Tax=Leifsonia xyli TaxID=1575 RepID=UPI003D678B72